LTVPVTVVLPGVLRPHAGGAHEVGVEGSTVGEVLEALTTEHPALGRRLRDERGDLRRFVNVYVGDTDVRDAQGLDTPVPAGAQVVVLPSVAGG
jgi:molybdopterin converting factor small subunit